MAPGWLRRRIQASHTSDFLFRGPIRDEATIDEAGGEAESASSGGARQPRIAACDRPRTVTMKNHLFRSRAITRPAGKRSKEAKRPCAASWPPAASSSFGPLAGRFHVELGVPTQSFAARRRPCRLACGVQPLVELRIPFEVPCRTRCHRPVARAIRFIR